MKYVNPIVARQRAPMNVFNQTAEYALRVMAYLATIEGDRQVRSAEISTKARIPRHYVSKVLRRLVVAGLVDSRRGRGGGFQLARPPSTIHFIDILEATDFNADDRHCAFGLESCNAKAPCPLHPAWTELTRCVIEWANVTTLEAVQPDGVVPSIPPAQVSQG
ncbi:MAG: Rrf2 family transcriptional regulator [Alphaproteobacteria bacterium]|nr:Rrf2 family transcriptional regulator [Alphaproteobacteria bacterium]